MEREWVEVGRVTSVDGARARMAAFDPDGVVPMRVYDTAHQFGSEVLVFAMGSQPLSGKAEKVDWIREGF
jgi:hypothetical protein